MPSGINPRILPRIPARIPSDKFAIIPSGVSYINLSMRFIQEYLLNGFFEIFIHLLNKGSTQVLHQLSMNSPKECLRSISKHSLRKSNILSSWKISANNYCRNSSKKPLTNPFRITPNTHFGIPSLILLWISTRIMYYY